MDVRKESEVGGRVASGSGNDVGKDGVRSLLVTAFAIPPASVAYAQTSKPVKVKVKTSAVAPVLKKMASTIARR